MKGGASGGRVVLDACVLIYLPLWSQAILDEVTRNLIQKWGLTPEKARRREAVLRQHFPEACVIGYEALISEMRNDPGDRHVLAAAVRAEARAIVTYNKRHFPAESVVPLRIGVLSPSVFLSQMYEADSGLFVEKLSEPGEGYRIGSAWSSPWAFQERSTVCGAALRGPGN